MSEKHLFKSNGPMPDELFKQWMFGSTRRIQDPKMPFYIFLPVATGILIYCWLLAEVSWIHLAGGIVGAAFFWTIYEYVVHRYFFHQKPTSKFWRKLLYTVHISHHDYPNDKRLMLIGPEVSIPGFFLFYGVFYLLLGHPMVHPFMFGLVSCYLFYDWLHYAAHNYHFRNRLFQYYKRHHMQHHYLNDEKNYGFTTTAWDKVMGTKLDTKEDSK